MIYLFIAVPLLLLVVCYPYQSEHRWHQDAPSRQLAKEKHRYYEETGKLWPTHWETSGYVPVVLPPHVPQSLAWSYYEKRLEDIA